VRIGNDRGIRKPKAEEIPKKLDAEELDRINRIFQD
jgi:hypothetical protein